MIRGLLGQLLADPTHDVPPASVLGNAACSARAAILSGSSAGSPRGHASARGRDSAQGKHVDQRPGGGPVTGASVGVGRSSRRDIRPVVGHHFGLAPVGARPRSRPSVGGAGWFVHTHVGTSPPRPPGAGDGGRERRAEQRRDTYPDGLRCSADGDRDLDWNLDRNLDRNGSHRARRRRRLRRVGHGSGGRCRRCQPQGRRNQRGPARKESRSAHVRPPAQTTRGFYMSNACRRVPPAPGRARSTPSQRDRHASIRSPTSLACQAPSSTR